MFDQGKKNKQFMERKWADRQYHVQDNDDVAHQYVSIYCNTNQFPALPFCGPHSKPHGARGSSKHYHFRFDPKLVNGVCAILRIPCACVACKSMLDKTCIYGIPPDEQECYKPVTKCTYWPLLGYFNNWNIIQLSQKSTPSDAFDEMHQVVFDGISDNMASLVESGKYGAIKTNKTKINVFYVIMFTSEAYKIQDNKTIDGQIITAVKLVVKAQYICYMQVDTNWYWNQHPQNHVITVPTHTILHPQLDGTAITDINDITKSICNNTQAKKSISIHPICLTDSDYNHILKEMDLQDKIEYKRGV